MNPIFPTFVKRLCGILFVSASAFLMQACVADDLRQDVLTVNIDPDYFSTVTDTWIFISDKNGNTLDAKRTTNLTQIKLSGAAGGTVTMSIFRDYSYTCPSCYGVPSHSFTFQTYQEIAVGSTIDLKVPTNINAPVPDLIGKASFTLHDYDDSDQPQYALIFSTGIASPYDVINYDSTTYAGNTFASPLRLRGNPSNVLVTTYRNDVPVYQWLNNVTPRETLDVSFNSFSPSKTIPINKQVYLGQVQSMQGASWANGYLFNLYSRQVSKSSHPQELPKLGYLDGFENYFVSVTLNPLDAKDNLYYTKAGVVPQSITFPDYTFTVNNTDLYNLSVKFSNDYTYKLAYFITSNTSTQVSWTLNTSDGEDFKTPTIPAEIKKLYPMLTLDGLKLEFAAYTKALDGYAYADYVKDNLNSKQRGLFEELRYVVME